jgi:hypothetical protein
MPSPFPGMDPYLEGSLWTTVHVQLSAEIARQLAPRLRPRYLALTAERFVIDSTEEPSVMPTPIPHVTVEIRDVVGRELVTAIEVLSPTNKRGKGRSEYISKRRRLLLSSAHLIEIDLLRQGKRLPMQQPLPPASYYVLVSRAEARPFMDVWPIPLNARLPVVPVPLSAGDSDVPLDLQLALTTVYDLCGYDMAVNYTLPPEIPLPPLEAAWAEERLRLASRSPSGRG